MSDDEVAGMLREQRMAEARDTLGAGQVRAAGQAAEGRVAGLARGQQREVRTQLAGTHAAQVLPARLAMARRPLPGEEQPGRPAGPRGGRAGTGEEPGGGGLPPGAPARAPARRDHEPVGIQGGGIEQLDLHAHEGMQADLPGRGREAHRPVEALVVGDGQPGQAQLHGSLDEVIGR